MKKFLLVFLVSLSTFISSQAQYTLSKSDGVFQVSGFIVPMMNFRMEQGGSAKNRFNLDYAVLKFDGQKGAHMHYQLQMNFPAGTSQDVNDEMLMQASIQFRNKHDDFAVSAGYDKIPFSKYSNTAIIASAFMQRAEMVRGKLFYRRDMGITGEKNFLNKRLNLYGGIYTGQGPASIIGDNDPSGKFLYVGRIEYSTRARMRNSEIDLVHLSQPNFMFGFAAMHEKKALTTGLDFPVLTVNGVKNSAEVDVSFMYKGLVFTSEYQAHRIQPNDRSILYGKPTDYYLIQGLASTLTYSLKKWNSVLAIRYDEINPNDLVKGDRFETLSFGYIYLFKGMNNALKFQYFKRLKDPDSSVVWSADQIRIGWLLQF